MSTTLRGAWRPIFQIVIAAVTIITILANWSSIKLGLQLVKLANWHWIAVGLTAVLISSLAASTVLCLLSPKLPFARTLLVQTASFFFNRIVPAGLGGLGLTTAYLRRQQKITTSQAGLIAAINNLIGFYVFCLILLLFSLDDFDGLVHWSTRTAALIMLAIAAVGLGGLLLAKRYRRQLARQWQSVESYLNKLSRSVWRLILAVGASSLITVSFILVMWCSARAVGSPLSFSQSARTFAVSQTAVSVAPTPGGLGATEVSASSFLGQQLSPARAVSVILTYRAVTYWLPIVPGFMAYLVARRHKII